MDGRGAAGAGTLGGQWGRLPSPSRGACSRPGPDRGGRAGGPARCLRPGCCAAHLRHFLAAAPQTLARAPRGREEGGGGRKGGGERSGQHPGWLRSDPGAARPLPSKQSRGAPGPLPGPPTPVDRTAKHAHPRTPAGWPRIPKDEVSIWDPQQVPGKQSRRSRPPTCAAPCGGAGGSPGGRGDGEESGKYIFQPSLWHKTLVTLWQCRAQRARGSAPRTHLRGGAGGLCRWPGASGPDSPGACAPARPAARRWPEDLPAVPPFRPPEPACESAAELRDGHRPSSFTTPPAYFVTSLLSTIIHSPQYWYPMHLSKIGTFPLTLAYHILMWLI